MKTGLTNKTIESLTLGAGVLVKKFNYADNSFADADIICATRGGATAACIATQRQIAVDGARENTAELQRIDYFTSTITATALDMTDDNLRKAIGAADIKTDTYGNTVIQPRHNLKTTDFAPVYWVGERSDGANVVIEIDNALNTNGLTITSADRGEGTVAFTLTAMYTIATQDIVPFKVTILKTTGIEG